MKTNDIISPHLAKNLLIRAMAGDPSLSKTALAVGIALCARHNAMAVGASSCFPSYETIAKDIGVTRRSAIEGVKKLVERGWFTKKTNGGRGYSNEYDAVLHIFGYEGSPALSTEELKRVTNSSPYMLGSSIKVVNESRGKRVKTDDIKDEDQRIMSESQRKETVNIPSPEAKTEGMNLRNGIRNGRSGLPAGDISTYEGIDRHAGKNPPSPSSASPLPPHGKTTPPKDECPF